MRRLPFKISLYNKWTQRLQSILINNKEKKNAYMENAEIDLLKKNTRCDDS